jgi:hypothetical protein
MIAQRTQERCQPRHVSAFAPGFTAEGDGALRAAKSAAEHGSHGLKVALFRYGAKHGLPNLNQLQCISELRLLCVVREEELALADKIEKELQQPPHLREVDEG